MSAGQRKREIPIDATRALVVLFASLIDQTYTDHEILTMCEETLRSLRSELSSTTRTATQIAIARAQEWNKKS
jgi:hypothetical protein